jgi:hypothetical protein
LALEFKSGTIEVQSDKEKMMNERIIKITEEWLGEGTREGADQMVCLMSERGWNIEYGAAGIQEIEDNEMFEADWNECLDIISTKHSRARLEEVMTAAEISEEFDITDQAVRDAISRGVIAARKSGGTWLLLRSDVIARWGHKLIDASAGFAIAWLIISLIVA